MLVVEDLQLGQCPPDPTNPALRSQLISRLGLSQSTVISPMARAGGQNEGVWQLEDGPRNIVLKLVRNVDLGLMLPTETERFVRLAAEHPSMLNDQALTFPQRIFRLKSANPGVGNLDLIVMNKAVGT